MIVAVYEAAGGYGDEEEETEYELIGRVTDGEITEDPDGELESLIPPETTDLKNTEMLLRRFNGPSLYAVVEGEE